MANQPIGIFDSGIGGLTVARSIANYLPNENIIYFGDTAHTPWGDKSKTTILSYCYQICDFLLQNNCKMIIIACNTASALAYNILSQYINNQAILLNVIDPMVNHIKKNYGNMKLGLIGTRQTIASNAYQDKLDNKISALATPLLVPIIEEGFFENSKITTPILEEYLKNDILKEIEGLILGCTHYPLLASAVNDIYENKVTIINSCNVMPIVTKDILKSNNLLSDSKKRTITFYVSDNNVFFQKIANLFFAKNITLNTFTLSQFSLA